MKIRPGIFTNGDLRDMRYETGEITEEEYREAVEANNRLREAVRAEDQLVERFLSLQGMHELYGGVDFDDVLDAALMFQKAGLI